MHPIFFKRSENARREREREKTSIKTDFMCLQEEYRKINSRDHKKLREWNNARRSDFCFGVLSNYLPYQN